MFRLFELVLDWKSSGLLCYFNGKENTSFLSEIDEKIR